MSDDSTKTYLGDFVYAEIGEGSIRLTIENGTTMVEEIWLEREVYEALVRYVRRRKPWASK